MAYTDPYRLIPHIMKAVPQSDEKGEPPDCDNLFYEIQQHQYRVAYRLTPTGVRIIDCFAGSVSRDRWDGQPRSYWRRLFSTGRIAHALHRSALRYIKEKYNVTVDEATDHQPVRKPDIEIALRNQAEREASRRG